MPTREDFTRIGSQVDHEPPVVPEVESDPGLVRVSSEARCPLVSSTELLFFVGSAGEDEEVYLPLLALRILEIQDYLKG